MSAYVTLMRRWGNSDGHTYIAGIASTADSAIRKGTIEKSRRAGKYEFQVWHCKGNNKTLTFDSTKEALWARSLRNRRAYLDPALD